MCRKRLVPGKQTITCMTNHVFSRTYCTLATSPTPRVQSYRSQKKGLLPPPDHAALRKPGVSASCLANANVSGRSKFPPSVGPLVARCSVPCRMGPVARTHERDVVALEGYGSSTQVLSERQKSLSRHYPAHSAAWFFFHASDTEEIDPLLSRI